MLWEESPGVGCNEPRLRQKPAMVMHLFRRFGAGSEAVTVGTYSNWKVVQVFWCCDRPGRVACGIGLALVKTFIQMYENKGAGVGQ